MSHFSTIEVLRGARAKIAIGWCQGASARDSEGRVVRIDKPEACCWCSIGGIYASAVGDDATGDRALAALVRALNPPSLLSFWNDEPARTQTEVLELFDRAIAQEERAP
jgi:hypothetical protein